VSCSVCKTGLNYVIVSVMATLLGLQRIGNGVFIGKNWLAFPWTAHKAYILLCISDEVRHGEVVFGALRCLPSSRQSVVWMEEAPIPWPLPSSVHHRTESVYGGNHLHLLCAMNELVTLRRNYSSDIFLW
jgi:hypothetical protein